MSIGRAPRACGVPAMARRATARLLLVTMLLLSAAPAAWPAAASAGHDGAGHPAAVADCGFLDHDASGHAPVDQGRAAPHQGAHDDATPGLGCCLGLLCPMLAAKLPAADLHQWGPLPHRRVSIGPPARPAGLDISPALPPPREAADRRASISDTPAVGGHRRPIGRAVRESAPAHPPRRQ